jgi:hypothetical protein
MNRSVHSWLKIVPEPVAVRVDGEHILKISKSPRRFTTADDALRAMPWERLEALDAKGAILRAMVNPDCEPEAPPAPASEDGGTLKTFAKLLSDAYKQGASDHSDAYKEAFKYMTNLVDVTSKRLTAIERILSQRLQADAHAIEDAKADAEEAAGGLGGIVGTMQSVAQVQELFKKPAPPSTGAK